MDPERSDQRSWLLSGGIRLKNPGPRPGPGFWEGGEGIGWARPDNFNRGGPAQITLIGVGPPAQPVVEYNLCVFTYKVIDTIKQGGLLRLVMFNLWDISYFIKFLRY